MINISKLTTGLLIQKDAQDITIDQAAISSALPAIIVALVDCGRAAGQARREGYEAGLEVGREQARIEHETSMRIAARQADDLVQALVGMGTMASAA